MLEKHGMTVTAASFGADYATTFCPREEHSWLKIIISLTATECIKFCGCQTPVEILYKRCKAMYVWCLNFVGLR